MLWQRCVKLTQKFRIILQGIRILRQNVKQIQDRIWWLRNKNAGHIANLRGPLAAFITVDGVLKQHVAEPENVGEYSYSEKDLTKIELYLKREERREL